MEQLVTSNCKKWCFMYSENNGIEVIYDFGSKMLVWLSFCFIKICFTSIVGAPIFFLKLLNFQSVKIIKN